MPFRAITPNINVNTQSGQLRTELQNTFTRLDGQLSSVPFTIFAANGPASNVASGETTLYAKALEVGSLPTLADAIAITVVGNTGVNTNPKTIRFYIGNTIVFDSGPQTFNNVSWVLRGEVIRNGATAQYNYFELHTSDPTFRSTVQFTTTNKDLAQNQSLSVTGTGGVTGDVNAFHAKMLLLSH